MKIVNKISLSFLAVALILAGIATSIVYSIAKDGLRKSIDNNLDTAVASRADHIETYLKMLEVSVGQLSKSAVLENLLKANGKEDSGWRDAFELAMKRLKRTKEVNSAIAEFLLLDKTGKVAASNSESNIGLDESTDAIFLGGQKETYIKDVYYSEIYKVPLLAVSAPILDSQTGELLGVLAARVRLNDLNNIVTEKTGMGDTGEIYVVNKYGFMVTPVRFKEDVVLKQRVHTQNTRAARLHTARVHALSDDKKISVFPDYRGVQVVGAHEYIPRMQWVVLAEIDAKEAFAPLDKLCLIFLMILFIVPIAAWLLGIFLAKLITDPLHKLRKGTEIIGSGNLDYKVGTNAKDEVGQLSRAFDAMTANLKTSTTSIESLNKEIAERKKAEESQKQLVVIIEATPDFVGFADAKDKHIIYMNKSGRKMVGVDEDEDVTKLKIFDVHPEWANKKFAEEILPVVVRDGIWTGECAFLNIIDRHEIPVSMVLSSHKTSNGEVEVFSTISRDISEHKRIEEALKDSERRFRAIFDHANDGILLADEETKEFHIGNNTICQMLGYSLEEIKNLGVTDIHPEEDLPYVLGQFERQVRKEIAVANDLPVKRKDGSVFYADVNTSSVALAGRTYLLGIFRDVTGRWQKEKELKKLHEELVSASHRAGMAEVAADVLHNVGNVLNSINVSATLITGKVTKSEVMNLEKVARIINEHIDEIGTFLTEHPQGKHIPVYLTEVSKCLQAEQTDIIGKLQVLTGNVQHIKEIISMQQAYAKVSGVEVQVSLRRLVEDAIQINSAGLQRHGTRLIREFEELPDVEIDKQKVLQILVNLISNAKYALSDSKKREKLVILRTYRHGESRFRIEVADNGVGIPEENLTKIFSHGFTTKQGGHGFGLHGSALAANEMGGSLTVYSGGLEQGATFTLELPFKPAKASS